MDVKPSQGEWVVKGLQWIAEDDHAAQIAGPLEGFEKPFIVVAVRVSESLNGEVEQRTETSAGAGDLLLEFGGGTLGQVTVRPSVRSDLHACLQNGSNFFFIHQSARRVTLVLVPTIHRADFAGEEKNRGGHLTRRQFPGGQVPEPFVSLVQTHKYGPCRHGVVSPHRPA